MPKNVAEPPCTMVLIHYSSDTLVHYSSTSPSSRSEPSGLPGTPAMPMPIGCCWRCPCWRCPLGGRARLLPAGRPCCSQDAMGGGAPKGGATPPGSKPPGGPWGGGPGKPRCGGGAPINCSPMGPPMCIGGAPATGMPPPPARPQPRAGTPPGPGAACGGPPKPATMPGAGAAPMPMPGGRLLCACCAS